MLINLPALLIRTSIFFQSSGRFSKASKTALNNDKPDFRRKIDDRWTPDVNEDYFNEILNDYLGDVRL